MSKEEHIFDLAIIGAGITGIGIAVAANQNKIKTVLIESQAEVASETSDNSLRIIHGGFRYLQKLNFPRTLKSIQAQSELFITYPDLIVALRCLMPLNASGLKSKYPAIIGAKIYHLLQRFLKSPLPRPDVKSESAASLYLPFLAQRFSHWALVWHDAQMLNPRELVTRELANLTEFVEIVTATKITEVFKMPDYYQLIDSYGNKIKAKSVVNSAAIGSESILKHNIPSFPKRIFWGKSFNLIFKDNRLLESAFAVASSEGRQFFVVPRGNNLIALGTFTAKANQEITKTDQLAAIQSFNQACPEFSFEFENLVQLEQGVLPAKSEFTSDADFLSADLILQADSYFQVYAAKYTTYRQFGRKIIQQVLRSKL